MIRTLMTVAILLAITGAVAADDDPIVARQAIYKSFGRVTKEPGQMLKGQAPFELAKVQEALKTIQDGAKRLPTLFPETSRTGHETEALPVIWEKKSEFEAIFVKLGADSASAMTAIKDEASFKTEFPKVLGDCGTCHKAFRAKR